MVYIGLMVLTNRVALWLECPSHDREVMGLILRRVIPKTLKIVPAACLSGTRHKRME